MKYDVFISYSRKDMEIADRICASFQRAGISYFMDRQGISGGVDFTEKLADAILNSRVILFLASRNSYESKFTNAELTFAFNEKPKNSILPYIIDGSTMPMAMRFVFSSINWRDMQNHPIDTVLIRDIKALINQIDQEPNYPPFYRVPNNLYDVVIYDAGQDKLKAIRCVNALMGVSLAEAKNMFDGAPCFIKEGVSEQEATSTKSILERAGVAVEVFVDKTSWDLCLMSHGPAPLMVVKVVKEAVGLSLLDAKLLVDNAPGYVARGISKSDAVNLARMLVEAGAKVEFR